MYSQNSEDEIIAHYFGNFKGTLLDAGANDGITFSNSHLLMQRGWEGYLFEPASVCGDLFTLYKDNQKAHIHNAGIGANEVYNAVFHESGAHVPNGKDQALVSTFKESELYRWRSVDFEERKTNILSFDRWAELSDNPTLDFITIDIEGMDWELLQAINLKEVGCKCLCIEWNSIETNRVLFTDYCALYGLKEIHRNAENLIFAL